MNGPVEPSADMRVFAKVMRDCYVAMVAEGFTPSEAMQIIGVVIASTIGNQKG